MFDIGAQGLSWDKSVEGGDFEKLWLQFSYNLGQSGA